MQSCNRERGRRGNAQAILNLPDRKPESLLDLTGGQGMTGAPDPARQEARHRLSELLVQIPADCSLTVRNAMATFAARQVSLYEAMGVMRVTERLTAAVIIALDLRSCSNPLTFAVDHSPSCSCHV